MAHSACGYETLKELELNVDATRRGVVDRVPVLDGAAH